MLSAAIYKKTARSPLSINSSSAAVCGKPRRPYSSNVASAASSSAAFSSLDTFPRRHLGDVKSEPVSAMLKTVGASSMDDLVSRIVPQNIRLKTESMNITGGNGLGEKELLVNLKKMAAKNRADIVSCIGMGYYNTITPHVIQRNFL